ncbi:MAG: hypothetical protein ACK4R8_01985, partial [Thiobacillus sp.]
MNVRQFDPRRAFAATHKTITNAVPVPINGQTSAGSTAQAGQQFFRFCHRRKGGRRVQAERLL